MPQQVTFGRVLAATAGLVVLVSVAELWSPRWAMILAVVTLLALFLRNPRAIAQIQDMLGLQGTTSPTPR